MAKKKISKEDKLKKDNKVELEGEITEILPGLKCIVKVDYQGIELNVKCYVSGKMRRYFLTLKKGDRVRIEVPLYDIETGRIIYRLTERNQKTTSQA